nr:DUF2935 domain-containing protein [Paenibacillus turpanensis]
MQLTLEQEHRFWLEVLEDHAYFVRDHLAPEESNWIEQTQVYINRFSELLSNVPSAASAGNAPASPIWVQFARNVYPVAFGYFQFEGRMQRLRIANEVNLNLTPTYLNGTLNENQEYVRMLAYWVNGDTPPPLPLADLLDLWLEDQLGHAILLRNILDPVEIMLSEQAGRFAQELQAYIVKNKAMRGYLRFTPPNFPAQRQFALHVGKTTVDFYRFVKSVVSSYRNDTLLNRTTLRFLEHHYPETCYLLFKLAEFEPAIPVPGDCSLSKPSFRETT